MSGKTQDRPSSDFILLVDDESQWLERMEKHLMAAGYNCLPVQDVELAIKAIQRLYPMVVLLDLKFYGDFTGWLVAEEALNRQIPSVVVTGHDVSWTRAVSQQYQVIDFDVLHLEYYESQVVEDSKNVSQFAPLPFFQNIINLLRSVVDDREILGVAVFTKEGKVIYTLVPIDTLFNIIKEYEY